jgi:hypothetical protein
MSMKEIATLRRRIAALHAEQELCCDSVGRIVNEAKFMELQMRIEERSNQLHDRLTQQKG